MWSILNGCSFYFIKVNVKLYKDLVCFLGGAK
jgi:hypothetical protein